MIIRKIPVANNSRWKFSKVHFKYRYSQPIKSENPVSITHVVWKDFGLLVSIKSIELDSSGFFKASRLFYKVCEIIRFTKRFHGSLLNFYIKISEKNNVFILTLIRIWCVGNNIQMTGDIVFVSVIGTIYQPFFLLKINFNKKNFLKLESQSGWLLLVCPRRHKEKCHHHFHFGHIWNVYVNHL